MHVHVCTQLSFGHLFKKCTCTSICSTRENKNAPGHSPTNYSRWTQEDTMYEVRAHDQAKMTFYLTFTLYSVMHFNANTKTVQTSVYRTGWCKMQR